MSGAIFWTILTIAMLGLAVYRLRHLAKGKSERRVEQEQDGDLEKLLRLQLGPRGPLHAKRRRTSDEVRRSHEDRRKRRRQQAQQPEAEPGHTSRRTESKEKQGARAGGSVVDAGEPAGELAEALKRLMRDQDAASYRRLHELVVSHPDYDPLESGLDELLVTHRENGAAAALARLQRLMATWVTNPELHLMLASVLDDLGNQDAADIERLLAMACIKGMEATGDGSRHQPYLVARVPDEYALLRERGLTLERQHTEQDGARHFDCLTCIDGSELWFDVTAVRLAIDTRLRTVAHDEQA